MQIKVKVNINTAKIMQQRGMGSSKAVQKYVASEVQRLCDPYVPMSSGAGAHMKNQSVIGKDGSSLVYPGPYAHYQYVGKVMGPNYQDKEGNWHSGKAPKHYTGDDLTYHGAPMRGPQWEKRMMADKKEELEHNVTAFINNKSK